jgi:hypothetical protein
MKPKDKQLLTKCQSVMNKYFGKIKPHLPIILMLLLGFGLRIWGVNHGMPYQYDPDEPTFVVLAGGILANRNLNPGWFGHPGTTLIYILAGMDLLIFVAGMIFGIFRSPEDFRIYYHQDPSLLYLSGRILNVIFAVLSIYILYKIVLKISQKPAAIFSALLLTIAPLHVSYSKFVRTDILVTLFILLAFYYCLKILNQNSVWAYILVGFFTGLGIATKYPAALISLIIILAHFLYHGLTTKRFHLLLISIGACLVGVFIGSPFLFLDYQSVLSDILHEGRIDHLGASGLGYFEKLSFYLQVLAQEAVTVPALVISGAWGVRSMIKRDKPQILVFAFSMLYLLSISILGLNWSRWIIPVIPFAVIGFSSAVNHLLCWVKTKTNTRGVMPTLSLLVLAMFSPLLYQIIQESRSLAGDDTRTLTRNWALNNLPSDSKILMETYTAIFPKEAFTFYYVGDEGDMILFDPDQSYKTSFKSPGNIGYLADINQLNTEGIDYVIMSHMYRRHQAENPYSDVVLLYEAIMAKGEIEFQAAPQSGQISGPEITVYQIVDP